MSVHCLTPNPALDITYQLDQITVHGVNRARLVAERPGGKGINVARLAAQHQEQTHTYGFLGGSNGQQISHLLAQLSPDIVQHWTTVPHQSRRTIAVVDDCDTTMFNEFGEPVSATYWQQLRQEITAGCAPGDVVTISGSLPPGSCFTSDVSPIIRASQSLGARVIVDTSGRSLISAAEAGADVCKPNHHELAEATGKHSLKDGIDYLLDAGAKSIVASRGAEGLVLGIRGHYWAARLNRSLRGNPTGAGDAVVAALAVSLARAKELNVTELHQALIRAIAWSAAAVLSPVAGEIDPAVANELVSDIEVEKI